MTPNFISDDSRIRLKTVATSLSDGSNVVDVYLNQTKLLACSEKDAHDLIGKLIDAIAEHTLNSVWWS